MTTNDEILEASSFVIICRLSSSFCRHFGRPDSSFVVIFSSFRAAVRDGD